MFGNDALRGFTYKGWTYDYDLQQEDDNCKTLHFASIAGDVPALHFDWSPYSNPTKEDFMLWVDLGCPERITNGPLDRKDLETIRDGGYENWLVAYKYEDGQDNFRRFTAKTYVDAHTLAKRYRGRICYINQEPRP